MYRFIFQQHIYRHYSINYYCNKLFLRKPHLNLKKETLKNYRAFLNNG